MNNHKKKLKKKSNVKCYLQGITLKVRCSTDWANWAHAWIAHAQGYIVSVIKQKPKKFSSQSQVA